MKKVVIKRPLVTFYMLAFVFSGLIWLPLVLWHTEGDATSGPLWWLHYLGGLGPALSAIVISALLGSRALSSLLEKLKWKRQNTIWNITGGLLPITLLVILFIGVGLFWGNWISLGDVMSTDKLPGVNLLGILIFELVFFGIGEELGWRGFAWPRLRSQYNLLVSSIFITLPWLIWHTPTFFYNDNMVNLGVGGTIGWSLSLFTGAVILGWLVDRAKGNILPAVLFHGILDVVFVSKAVAGTYDSFIGAAVMILSFLILGFSIFNSDRKMKQNLQG